MKKLILSALVVGLLSPMAVQAQGDSRRENNGPGTLPNILVGSSDPTPEPTPTPLPSPTPPPMPMPLNRHLPADSLIETRNNQSPAPLHGANR